VHGWSGWQWLFLLEGLPSVLLGVWTLFYLDDGIHAARWLNAGDKQTLARELAADPSPQHMPLAQLFRSGAAWRRWW
jgi:ABC-type phosphate transport system permease subunit